MTLHVVYNHECPKCQAHYIPYDDISCPNCGWHEEERFDYIPQAAGSVKYNLRRYGSYVPPAWWVGSLGDHILHILFYVFENYRQQTDTKDFSEYASIYLSRVNWGDQSYLRNHLAAIALRVHDEMEKEDEE